MDGEYRVAETMTPRPYSPVMVAAGSPIHGFHGCSLGKAWMPAYAGMTGRPDRTVNLSAYQCEPLPRRPWVWRLGSSVRSEPWSGWRPGHATQSG